jgi:hypothetical protein
MMREDADRQKLVEERIRQSEADALTGLALIREAVRDFLIREKGYRDDDIEVDAGFVIRVDNRETPVSVDYILRLRGRRFMVIKCSPGAVESRERHLISFARVVGAYQIPYAMVTDGVHARMLDAVKGCVIAEGLDALPARQQAVDMMNSVEFMPYPAERREREERILLAFESIKCTEESCE